MKSIIVTTLIVFPVLCFSQFGLKAGLNFANVSNASSINNSSRSGFHVGLLFGTSAKHVIGSRTELIFSRQGYNYKTSTNTGNVNLDYLMLPQYMSINITKYFSIQFGGQVAYLVNAKADSSNESSNSANPYGKMMGYYNKFDFGYGGGIEIHPVRGLLIGARINISVSKLYEFDYNSYMSNPGSYPSTSPPSFIPKVDVKNNVFQVFAGWQFVKQENKKQKKSKQDAN